MPHLDTAYKLGSLAAVDNFTAWLQNDDGNPTAYPKRRGVILKTAEGVMQPNPSVTQPPAKDLLARGTGGPVGGPVVGSGAAPVTPVPKVSSVIERVKMAIIGSKSQTCKDVPEACNPGAPPKPPPPPPPQQTKASADRAVEQVMRKLGKSMSRRPLSRDGTKYEAIKKKLRKQKPKKA